MAKQHLHTRDKDTIKAGYWLYCLLAAVVFFLLFPVELSKAATSEEERYGNTPGNITQGGSYIYSNGWVYTTANDTFLYKMRPDGSKKMPIDIYRANSLNYKNGVLYYLRNGKLYRNILTGKKEQSVGKESGITKIIVYDKYIYYMKENDDNKLYRMKLDGSGKKRLTGEKGGKYMNLTKSYLFYSTEKGLYRINQDGTNKIRLSKDRAKDIVSDSNYLYYIDDRFGYLMRCKYDGSGRTQLSYDHIIDLNILGDTLYYVNGDDGSKLYAITNQGRSKTKITDEQVFEPNILQGYAYYRPGDENKYDNIKRVKLIKPVEIKNAPDVTGNFAGNIINGAFTAYSSSKVYFCDPWLYIAPMDYTDKSQLRKYSFQDYKGIYGINIVGDYIYFSASKNNYGVAGGIYRVRKDGAQPPVLLTKRMADYMTVVGDWIYFTSAFQGSIVRGSGTIFRMKIDGSELKDIGSRYISKASCLNIIGDTIYFLNAEDGDSIYRINTDGSGIRRLSEEGSIKSMQVIDQYIYYHGSKGLMRMSIEGGLGETVLSTVSDTMMVYQDRIYYFQLEKDLSESLYTCKLDGSDIVRLDQNVYDEELNITQGYVYYKNKYYIVMRTKIPA